MASHCGRGKDFSPEPRHFFKVVLEDNIRDGKLEIPRKFARDYGNALSSPVFFKVPNGEIWEVELKKCDRKIWLQSGWKKFAERYSLEFGHLLVCRYEGNCRFHVLIFDGTATEIEYPYSNGIEEAQLQEVKIEESEDDESLEIINDISAGKRENPELHCPRPRKILRANPGGRTERSSEFESMAAEFKHNNRFSAEKSKAIKRARSAFKSTNPSFFAFMQTTYVALGSKRGTCVRIPRDFSRDHLKGHGDVILLDSNGKTWPAKYRSNHGSNRRQYVKLCNGWDAFVRDKNLHVGDVCAFELINSTEISLKVSILRGKNADFHGSRASTDDSCPARREAGTSSAHGGCLPEPLEPHETALQRARAFKPENPSFLVELQRSYVRTHALCVPNQFARDHFNSAHTKVDVTLCLPNGKSWRAEYHQRSSGRPNGRICNGWKAFVKDNNLKVGDACVLQMTDDGKISFKVFIFQATADSNCNPSQGVSKKPSGLTSQFAKSATEKASMPTEKASMPSFFKKVVLPLHLKECRVSIPFRFVEQYLKPDIKMVILQVADRSWPVKIRSNSHYRAAKLTSGWIDFARENSLKKGDICVYELDTVNKCMLKVSISRSCH